MRTRSSPKQLSFLPPPPREYGGEKAKGKRKIRRPFDPKKPLHLTLRSSHAKGACSMLKKPHRLRIQALLVEMSEKYGIRIYQFANVGNHLHLLLQARTRKSFQGFLREFSGKVASQITGAIKGRPLSFWDHLAHTKIIEWGRQFKSVMRYVLLNLLESSGMRDRALLEKLERDGFLVLGRYETAGVGAGPPD